MKPIREQTIVITGASSGIGLATARLAAEKGARVVLSSRNEPELQRIAQEIRSRGGQAIAVAADVANEQEVRRIADAAIEAFGGFDTWFNNAGVGMYGASLEIPIADQRRLFDVNFWGEVYGMRAAVEHLRRRGGTLVNMGSVEAERAVPLHGAYAASKHALKAYTDAVRMELEKEGAPVAVVLIEPASIDTPFPAHSRSYLGREPDLPPPVFAPEVVARAVLHAAEHPQRTVLVGGSGAAFAAAERFAPRVTDKYMERTMFEQQQKDRPPSSGDALFEPPAREGEIRGHNREGIHERSAYTWAEQRGMSMPLAMAAAAAVGGFLAFRSKRQAGAARAGTTARWRGSEAPAGPARPVEAPADLWRGGVH